MEAIQAHLLHGGPPAVDDGGLMLPVGKLQSTAEAAGGALQIFVDARSRTTSQASDAARATGSSAEVSCKHDVAPAGGDADSQGAFLLGEDYTDFPELGRRQITL